MVLAAAGLVLLVVLTFSRSFQADFIWDDDIHLTLNPCIIGPKGLLDIWTSAEARICPLTLTMFWLEYQFWGLEPMPYHIVNVLMHALNAILLWRVLIALDVRGAWLGSALWALHPVQVETVAWVTELKNTLSGCFFLLTLLAFVRWRRGQSRYAWVIFAAALAMAGKSSTVVLPLVLGLCWWWMDRRWNWRNVARLLPILALSALTAVISIWTQVLEGGITDEWHLTPPERLITAGRVVWAYLGKLLIPHPLMFIYPRWELATEDWVSYLPAAALVVLASVLWWRRSSFPAVGMAFGCFVVLLLPVMGLVDHFFLRYSFVGDHFQYLASMAPLALIAAGLTTVTSRLIRSNAARVTLAFLLLLIPSLLSWHHSRIFENNFTLWKHSVSSNPDSWLACGCLATEYMARGDVATATALARRAANLNSRDCATLVVLGGILAQQGFTDEARSHIERSLELYERNAQAHNSLGILLLNQGLTEDAITHFRRSIELGATGVLPRIMLGTALYQKGSVDAAVREWQQVLAVRPESGLSHANLCMALVHQGKIQDALHHGALGVRYEPGLTVAHNVYGAALRAAGQLDEAGASFEQALEIDPNFAAAHHNLALLLRSRGQIARAAQHHDAALRLFPTSVELATPLAWLLATCPDSSIQDVRRALSITSAFSGTASGQSAVFMRAYAASLAAVSRFSEAAQAVEIAITRLGEKPTDEHPVGISANGLYLADTPSDAELLRLLKEDLEQYRQARPLLDASLQPRP